MGTSPSCLRQPTTSSSTPTPQTTGTSRSTCWSWAPEPADWPAAVTAANRGTVDARAGEDRVARRNDRVLGRYVLDPEQSLPASGTASPTTQRSASGYLDATGGRQGAARGTRVVPDETAPAAIDSPRRDRRAVLAFQDGGRLPPRSATARALAAALWNRRPFDGRRLGKENFGRVRRPVPEFALFGGTMMVRRAEVNQLLTLLAGIAQGRPC